MKMKNITEPYPGIFQVRVRRNHQIYSTTFKASQEGSRDRALDKAKAWRDQVKGKMGSVVRVGGKTRQNKTTGVHGIHSKVTHSPDGKRVYFKLSVHYKNGEHKNREFSAGNLNELTRRRLFHVFKVAFLFRKKYEHSKEGSGFTKLFSNWKDWSEKNVQEQFEQLGITGEEVEKSFDVLVENLTLAFDELDLTSIAGGETLKETGGNGTQPRGFG